MKSESEILKSIFKSRWDDVFIYDRGRKVTYAGFLSSALAAAGKLSELKVKKRAIVCLHLSNSIELLLLYFAMLIEGAVAAPVDPQKGESEVGEIIEQLKPDHIISESGITALDPVRLIEARLFDYDKISKTTSADGCLKVFDDIDYDRLFLITFTSGSTGKPKGVMHTFSNLMWTSQAFNDRFHFGEGHVFYHNLPMTYMAGILNLFILPMLCGSKIALGNRFDVKSALNFWTEPIRYGVNVFWFTPTILSLLLKLDRGDDGVHYATEANVIGLVGTAPLYTTTKEAFEQKYHITLYESYGLSEVLFLTTNSPLSPVTGVGLPLNGVGITIAEDREILADVPWQFSGYINDDSASRCSIHPYHTGDLGGFDAANHLFITGRKKDLIIRGGVNISPAKIERTLDDLKMPDEKAVVGISDETLGEKTVCFYVSGSISKDNLKAINKRMVQRLGRDYSIDEFIRVDEIPKNLSGKVDKILLKEKYRVLKKDEPR